MLTAQPIVWILQIINHCKDLKEAVMLTNVEFNMQTHKVNESFAVEQTEAHEVTKNKKIFHE